MRRGVNANPLISGLGLFAEHLKTVDVDGEPPRPARFEMDSVATEVLLSYLSAACVCVLAYMPHGVSTLVQSIGQTSWPRLYISQGLYQSENHVHNNDKWPLFCNLNARTIVACLG